MIVREYHQRMLAADNREFDFTSVEGFLAAKLFTEGLCKTGNAPTRESLTKALESLNDYDMGGFHGY